MLAVATQRVILLVYAVDKRYSSRQALRLRIACPLGLCHKDRRQVFDGDAIQRLKVMFEKVCSDFEAQLVEMHGQAEHVHLLITYPPKHSVSSMVNSLKGVSSRLLRMERPDIEKRYWKDVLWSPSYFAASCGGAPLGIIKQYVEQQKTPL
jgi:putative transposase